MASVSDLAAPRGVPKVRPFVWMAVLAAVTAVFCFYRLSYPDIRAWDEGTNAGVVAATIDGGSLPALETSTGPFFEKPPLWYYLAVSTVATRGFDAVSLRLPAALAGFALILLVAWGTMRLHSPAAGIVAAMFMLACGHLFTFKPDGIFSTHHIRSADSDLVQILFLFAAFLAFGRWAEGRRSGLYWGAAWSGLAVLAKGPLGLLPAAVFAIWHVSTRRIDLPRRDLARAALVFAYIVVPWHLYMLWKFGWPFVDEYLMRAIVSRAGTTLEGHSGPWYYYLQILRDRAVCCSAELVAIAVVVSLVKRAGERAYARLAPALFVAFLMVLIAAMQTKLAWYMLPLYPFAAVMVGDLFERCRRYAMNADRTLLRRALAGAVTLAIALDVSAYAARDLRNIVTLKRGWMEPFFERAVAECGEDLAYGDKEVPGDVAFLLRRLGVDEHPADASRCVIALRVEAPPTTRRSPCARVEQIGHLALWDCGAPETVTVGSFRRGAP